MLNLGTNSKNVWLAGWAGWLAPFASCLSLSLSLSYLLGPSLPGFGTWLYRV